MKYQQTIKQTVTEVLRDIPETRNNDLILYIWVWYKLKPGFFFMHEGENCIRTKDILLLPDPEAIKRIRAHIQNDNEEYLPTDPDILRKRKKRQSNWREEVLEL